MHNKEENKQKALEMLRQASQEEVQYTKKQNFERAVSFALEEVSEFEVEFKKFLSNVSHLEVFQANIKEPLTRDFDKLLGNLKYLIEKNYTEEEKSKMPEEVLNQVRNTQQVRVDLLKKVAKRYIKPKNQ